MKNYFFDFDGTLADSGQTGIMAIQAAFKSFSLDIPNAETIQYYMGIPIEISFKKMSEPHQFTSAEFDELLQSFRDFYQSYENQYLSLFDGIKEALIYLSENDKNLFVVSSKHSSSLIRNLDQLGILNFFKAVIGSDQVENYKPAPDGINALVDKYHLSPKDSIMIGDAIFDLQMGKAAGVHTCGVTWGAHDVVSLKSEQPDFLIDSPSKLMKLDK